jgi:diguanylate cyclase (GGDEF)-like protein
VATLNTALWLVILIGLAVFIAGTFRWRVRVMLNQQAELMRLVRERTQQLEEANRKLAQISYLDAVTEVSNRRSFEEELTMEWRRSRRTGSRLSLLMIDIDNFKAYNDSLGHQAGDECLKKVAAVIDEGVRRAGDVVARYGGEDFAVLLPDTDLAGASALADRIRAAVEGRGIAHPATQKMVTVSIGVATASGRDDGDAAQLVRAADAALYRAKGDGRNLVRVSDAAVV